MKFIIFPTKHCEHGLQESYYFKNIICSAYFITYGLRYLKYLKYLKFNPIQDNRLSKAGQDFYCRLRNCQKYILRKKKKKKKLYIQFRDLELHRVKEISLLKDIIEH